MKTIAICDTTLKSPSAARLSFRERVEIARHLQGMGVDAIELGPIENVKPDTLFVRTLSTFVEGAILTVETGIDPAGVALAQEALRRARRGRLQVRLPLSAVQMEYTCGMKPPALLARLQQLCSACVETGIETEFVAEDATRADSAFLHQALAAAVACGVSQVTLCDTAGQLLGDEVGAFLRETCAAVPALGAVAVGMECRDTLHMACAGAAAALQNGAVSLKTAVIGGEYPTPVQISDLLRARGTQLGLQSGLQSAQIGRLSRQVQWIADTRRSEGSAFDAGVRDRSEEDLLLGPQDDEKAVENAVRRLGYDLTMEDYLRVYEAVHKAAATKNVTAQELETVIATVAMQVPATYTLQTYAINSGNTTRPSAQITLEKQGQLLQGICLGDGPIDAAFLAVEQLVGSHYELDDFQIQSVSQGRGAMGAALVRLRSAGKVYAGRGVSTDVIGASIMAYLSALNKIAYEENDA